MNNIFSIFLDDAKIGRLKPKEDFWAISNDIFCIADGITRDPLMPSHFHNDPIDKILKEYPNPSPAAEAAETFCSTFLEFLCKSDDIKNAFICANKKIAKINKTKNPKPDYLVNDFFGCVASGCKIKDNKLFWGFIGDCGIAVFNKDGNVKFQTENGLKNFEEYVSQHPGDWSDPERRKYIRSQFRNKHKVENGCDVGYGALTGENQAIPFIKNGITNLSKYDIVILYSDGFAKLIKEPNFCQAIYNSFQDKSSLIKFDKNFSSKNYPEYGHERTLIAIRI